MASIYKRMPVIAQRSEWLAMSKRFRPGPQDPFRPPVHAQGSVPRCNSEAATAAMEYLLAFRRKYKRLDAAELHERLPFAPKPTGPAIGFVFDELVTNGVSGVKIDPPIYDIRGFAGAFTAVCHRWPVVIQTLDPQKPGPDGWATGFRTQVGHALFGFKPAVRGRGTDNPEFGIWCQQSRGSTWSVETENCVVLSESVLERAAIYAIRTLSFYEVDDG